MTSLPLISRRENPILWQESCHQRRGTPRILRRYSLIGPLLALLMVVGVVLTLPEIRQPTREIALYAIWFVHTIVAVRAIIAGANVISREHVGQTWDALILTGVSARQILFGKWWAALGRAAPWMLILGAFRLAMIPVFLLALLNRYAWYGFGRSGGYMYDGPEVGWLPWASFTAVGAVVVLTVLEVVTCTALGVAFSALTRRGLLAMIFAFIARFTPVALFAAFTRYTLGTPPSWRLLEFTPFAVADSGTSPVAVLSLPLITWTYGDHERALGGVIAAILVLLVLLVLAVCLSWLSVRLMGALPHTKSASVSHAFRIEAANEM